MIHTFKAVGQPMLLDVGSGALNSAIAWVFRIFCRIVGLS